MHAKFVAILAAVSAVVGTPLPRDDTAAALDQLNTLAQAAYNVSIGQVAESSSKRGYTCSLGNLRVRREWTTLPKSDKISYINAVKCLQSAPAKTPADIVPGARSRFDDFVGTHINQSLIIHYTGNFLSWHRYFTWLYEEALRNECGYKGTQPYWDWAKTASIGLEKYALFDGSETSLSGNGEYIGPQPDIILGASTGLPPVYLPTGTGGGCVTSGPFKNMSVNLGPAALDLPGGDEVANPAGPLTYNPRCLKRDLSDKVNQRYANATSIINNILKPQTVYDFQMQMQGIPGTGDIGIHGGGHYSLGGDPGRDVFTSPGDPAFYFHHSMIDRTWWMWQALNPAERIYSDRAISGTNTFFNNPPSANTTLDDYVQYGYAAGPARKIRDLMSTLDGPFCYVYL